MKINFILLIGLIVVFLTFSSPALAADGFGVNFPNPLAGANGNFSLSNITTCLAHSSPLDLFWITPQGIALAPTCLALNALKNTILAILGSITIIMFLWAAILFVTSAGNPGQIDKAKKIIIYTVIGVAIILSASGILALIKAIIPPLS